MLIYKKQLLTPRPTTKIQMATTSKLSTKKFKPSTKLDTKRKSKKDKIFNEECITPKFEKSEKIRKCEDLKFVVNLNKIVREMVKNHACRKTEKINKLHNFMFKSTNCISCMQKGRYDKFNQQKRTFSTDKEKILSNINKKHKLIQHKPPPFSSINKNLEKYQKAMIFPESSDFTRGSIVPLYLLVKSKSRRNKTYPSVTINFQYRVGSNHAFVPLERKKTLGILSQDSKKYILTSMKTSDSLFTKYPLTLADKNSSKRIKQKTELKNKLQEIFLKPRDIISNEGRKKKDLELNGVLADILKKVLIPLLQEEHLKYSEVKKGWYIYLFNFECFYMQSL